MDGILTNGEILKQKLAESFPGAEIIVDDLVGDDNHYSATISHESFAGKSKVASHIMVNKALEGFLGDKLHALSIKTIAK